MKQITEPEILVDSCNGIYCGQRLCKLWADQFKNKEDLKEDIDICLAGPDHEFYTEAWANIMDNAILVYNGQEFTVENSPEGDGDIWAIPEGYEWPE